MDNGQLDQGIRAGIFAFGKWLDRRGGWSSHGARIVLGSLRPIRDSVEHGQFRTVTWSPRAGMWMHRWPEGRVASARRWRRWEDWATGGGYDMDDLVFRHYRPRRSDVVVEVGAGHGGETFALAHMVGPSGKVLAIEAAPSTYHQLENLCRLNAWSQVDPVQAALSDRHGKLTMSATASWVTANIYEPGDTEVPAMTLDDLCRDRGITAIDWLKMNIEGAEKEAIRGMEEMAPRIRNMTISCHDFLGTDWGRSKDEVVAWRLAHGFTVRNRSDGEPWAKDYVYATRSGS